MPCQGKQRGWYTGGEPTSPQAPGTLPEGPSRRQPARCALTAAAGDAHPSSGRRRQDQPVPLPPDSPSVAGCKRVSDVPHGYDGACSKTPQQLSHPPRHLSGGRQCLQTRCGYRVGTPGQLSSSAISPGPGWGPSAPSSPLRRSRLLDHCINLLQKHPAPCPDHGPARLSPSYHNPPFALCPHPLSLPDGGRGASLLPERCHSLRSGRGNSSLQRKAASPRAAAGPALSLHLVRILFLLPYC